MNTIFKNFKVIELSSVLAGPSVGMFFAELGADIIKVENPKTNGDVTRNWKLPNENDDDLSSYFCSVNWGKKSIGLDFCNPAHYEILIKLISKADLVTVSFKPGDDKKLNLDYETIRKINPKIIYAHITGFGLNDERTAFDAVLQAYAGFTYINGTKESGPIKMPVALIDVLAAHQIKEAVLVAYINRLINNEGSYINCSLLQSGISSLVNQSSNYLVGKTIPEAVGSDHPNIVPYGTTYRTNDDKLIVLAVGNDKQFMNLCQVLDIIELSNDQKFSTNHKRVKNRIELNEIISEKIASRNSAELIGELNEKKIPAALVLNMKEVFEQKQAEELLLKGNNKKELLGVKSFCANIDKVENKKDLLPPPRFNQHGNEILKNELNLNEDEINKIFL